METIGRRLSIAGIVKRLVLVQNETLAIVLQNYS